MLNRGLSPIILLNLFVSMRRYSPKTMAETEWKPWPKSIGMGGRNALEYAVIPSFYDMKQNVGHNDSGSSWYVTIDNTKKQLLRYN